MIKNEAVDEMLLSKEELERKLFYLEAVLNLELSRNVRRVSEAQKRILQDEIKEIQEMLEAEYEEMHIGSVMMDIYQAKEAVKPLNKYQLQKERVLPANVLRSGNKRSLINRIRRIFRI